MKKILLSSVALFGIAGTAVAADLPARMPVKAPPIMAPAFNWTGCYIGVNGGGSWKNTHFDVTHNNLAFFGPAFAAGATPSLYNLDNMSGGMAGGQIGCNWQPVGSQFVLGIEADYDWANIKGSQSINTAVPGFVNGFGTASENLKSIGTARGRLGYAFDPFLLYVTGGVAWARTDYSYSFAFPGTNELYLGSASGTRTGWTVGGGGEYAFGSNWSAKLEALWYQLDGTSFTAPRQTLVGPVGAAHLVTAAKDDGWMLRAGINYRFGAGPAMARY